MGKRLKENETSSVNNQKHGIKLDCSLPRNAAIVAVRVIEVVVGKLFDRRPYVLNSARL